MCALVFLALYASRIRSGISLTDYDNLIVLRVSRNVKREERESLIYTRILTYTRMCDTFGAEVMNVEEKNNIPTGLELNAIEGKFGSYLANPHSAKERMQIVAKNLAVLRMEAGMAQRDVCEIIGCAPQTYSGYEKGKHEPTVETLVRLSHLYGVTMDYLVSRNNGDDLKSAVDEHENMTDNRNLHSLFLKMQELSQKVELLERNSQ